MFPENPDEWTEEQKREFLENLGEDCWVPVFIEDPKDSQEYSNRLNPDDQFNGELNTFEVIGFTLN